MKPQRLIGLTGFSIDQVAAAAGDDPGILRLENLDTDLPPPAVAVAATRSAIGLSESNSYLPFNGTRLLRDAIAERLSKQTGHRHRPEDVVVTCGGTEGMLDALMATVDPGDEVILTDPTYAGMINRVRLVGAVPKLAPMVVSSGEWRLNLDALRSLISNRTRALFLMNPSMPSGAVFNNEEWETVADLCRKHSLWLIYNAAMERILFDDRPYTHPAALTEMLEHTITIGSVSKEYRMIGWRIGWVVGPARIMSDIERVHIYNAVTPPGIAQAGATTALTMRDDGLTSCVTEWQRRRDIIAEELRDFSIVPAAGGWSMLVDVGAAGYDSVTASRLLLERGQTAATPMRGWGEQNNDQYVRLVFSKEPVQRLRELRDRFRRALG